MHSNKVTIAILVDGKSLYENKNELYIPFGKEYNIFIKNDNSFDVKIKVKLDLLLAEDIFLVKANEKRIVKGFSHMGDFYQYKFIEKNDVIKKHNPSNCLDGMVSFSVYKTDFLGIRGFTKQEPLVLFNNNADFSTDFNPVLDPTLSVDSIHGMHTFGKPVKELTTSTDTLDSMLFSHFFILKGVNDDSEKIIKPLFAKDNIRCSVCLQKVGINNCYCSHCGSYIIKTASIIDEKIETPTRVERRCCNIDLLDRYIYCPYCGKNLNNLIHK